MSSLNRHENFPSPVTHEGAPVSRISPEQILSRSVLSCFLWEKEFYEDGIDIARRINETALLCDANFVANLAINARTVHGLRHVPLLLLISLLRRPKKLKTDPRVADVIAHVISRPDELTELLSLYWIANQGRKETTKLDRQLVKGLAKAIKKFDEYSLAKYNRDTAVKLRDVLFLSHAKPDNEEQRKLFKKLANNELQTPDTWEVELSAGKDKKETFERLIQEGKLGYMALLRNLRNMVQAGCNPEIVKRAILERKGARYVLPFRYTAAARHAPMYEKEIDEALQVAIKELPVLKGSTIVLVDVSGSMTYSLSQKSDLTRMDAAATLASIINAESLRVFSFSANHVEVPARRGMAGVDAIIKSQRHSSTRLAEAIQYINTIPHDRLIVITDEQAQGRIPDPVCQKAYMINVASYQNGIGYKKWVHLDGFSENIIKFIHALEG